MFDLSHLTSSPDLETKTFLLPLKFPTPGRCRSLDCGILHEDGSTSCRQCVSRRIQLMKKARIQGKHQDATAKQDKLVSDFTPCLIVVQHTWLTGSPDSRIEHLSAIQMLWSPVVRPWKSIKGFFEIAGSLLLAPSTPTTTYWYKSTFLFWWGILRRRPRLWCCWSQDGNRRLRSENKERSWRDRFDVCVNIWFCYPGRLTPIYSGQRD